MTFSIKAPVTTVIALAAVSAVMSSSVVKKSNWSYQCCDRPVVHFNQSCDNRWDHDDRPFAYYKDKGLRTGCIPPCKEIREGLMVLDRCTDMEDTMVCKGVTAEEERIKIRSLRCSGSISAPGSVILLLLLAGITVISSEASWTF